MAQLDDVACRILKFEQQLKAYESLHASELAEMWQVLNELKRAVADALSTEDQIEGRKSNG